MDDPVRYSLVHGIVGPGRSVSGDAISYPVRLGDRGLCGARLRSKSPDRDCVSQGQRRTEQVRASRFNAIGRSYLFRISGTSSPAGPLRLTEDLGERWVSWGFTSITAPPESSVISGTEAAG